MDTLSNKLSNKELNAAQWIAQHRALLQKIHLGWWVVVASLCWIAFIVTATNWLTHRRQTTEIEQSFTSSLINFEQLRTVQAIAITDSRAVRRSGSTIDAVVTLTNPNQTTAAHPALIQLAIGGRIIGERQVALAPNETRVFVETRINYSGDTLPSIQVRVVDTSWQIVPLGSDTLPDYNWQFTEPLFSYIDTSDGTQSRFTIRMQNPSLYSATNAEVIVRLLQTDGTIAAVDRVSLQRVEPESSQQLQFVWPSRLSSSLQANFVVQLTTSDQTQ